MLINDENIEKSADRRADRYSFGFISFFIFLSWIVLSTSDHMEAEKEGKVMPWLEHWLTEFTSHAAILIAVLIIPYLLSRYPLTLENWKRKLPIYLLGFFIFGAIHIILMDIFRRVSFPPLLGRPYYEGLLDLRLWIYELRKDAYSYLLMISVFLTGRHIEQLRREARNTKQDAKETGRLTLKSGGRTIFLNADEIIWAESAANYVEIYTAQGHHLIRMTLSALEALLAEAGDAHIRTHRSYLVKRDMIREIRPSRDGSASLTLSTGKTLSVGRKYRQAMP